MRIESQSETFVTARQLYASAALIGLLMRGDEHHYYESWMGDKAVPKTLEQRSFEIADRMIQEEQK